MEPSAKPNHEDFVITRELNAPREKVFRAWTEAGQLEKWWGPKGFALGVHQLEVRPGGTFHYSMALPDGQKMWGKFVYREINAPEKLVFINSFSDEKGGITRAPFSDNWPKEMLNQLTLKEENGKTLLTLCGNALNATDAEQQIYFEGHASMHQGFAGTFDQLEAYLGGS